MEERRSNTRLVNSVWRQRLEAKFGETTRCSKNFSWSEDETHRNLLRDSHDFARREFIYHGNKHRQTVHATVNENLVTLNSRESLFHPSYSFFDKFNTIRWLDTIFRRWISMDKRFNESPVEHIFAILLRSFFKHYTVHILISRFNFYLFILFRQPRTIYRNYHALSSMRSITNPWLLCGIQNSTRNCVEQDERIRDSVLTNSTVRESRDEKELCFHTSPSCRGKF